MVQDHMWTYREENVSKIEQHQNQVAHSVVVVSVRSNNQGNSDEVVRQHLPMVLATLFDVDNEDLLKPKGPLTQYIRFLDMRELSCRPIREHLSEIQKVFRCAVNVLETVRCSIIESEERRRVYIATY